jgi:hypothetical protein
MSNKFTQCFELYKSNLFFMTEIWIEGLQGAGCKMRLAMCGELYAT